MNELSFNTSTDEWLEIGTIVAPHGVRGRLRVYPDSDFPERFQKPGLRWLQRPNTTETQPIQLLDGYRVPGKELYVVQLAGIEDREQAKTLRGCKLLVAKSDRPHLTEDEYHISDLIDLEVYNQATGEAIGVVTDVYRAGNDLLAVKLHSSSEPPDEASGEQQKQRKKLKPSDIVFVPFVKDIVPVVNLEAGRMEITPPPGLLEVNQP